MGSNIEHTQIHIELNIVSCILKTVVKNYEQQTTGTWDVIKKKPLGLSYSCKPSHVDDAFRMACLGDMLVTFMPELCSTIQGLHIP